MSKNKYDRFDVRYYVERMAKIIEDNLHERLVPFSNVHPSYLKIAGNDDIPIVRAGLTFNGETLNPFHGEYFTNMFIKNT